MSRWLVRTPASRTRNPINIAAAQENILHPGYQDKVAQWQSRVMPAQAKLDLALQQMKAQEVQEQIAAQAEERMSHAQQRLNMANPHYGQREVDAAYAKENLPWLAPEVGKDGVPHYYIDKTAEANLTKPIPVSKLIPVSEYGGLYDPDQGKLVVTPGGRPDKPETEPQLRMRAASGDAAAIKAVKNLDDEMARRAREGRPSTTINNVGALDGAALDQAADMYAATGTMPNVGFGRDAAAMRLQIMKRAADRHPDNSLANAKTDYLANQGTIKDITKNRTRVLTSEGTASKNLDLAANVSGRVDRTGSPLANKYLLYLKGQVAGDDDTQLLNNAVETAANEYANVVTAGSGGGTAATDSSRQHAREMLHSSMANGTFQKVVAQMKQEMANRRSSFDDQLKTLQTNRPGTNAPQPQPQQLPRVASQAQFNALPKGAHYISTDGQEHLKP